MRSKIITVQKSREISALLAVPGSRIIAGGTAFSPDEDVPFPVDISGVEGLDGVRQKGSRLEIGPLATLSSLAGSAMVRNCAPALAEAAGSTALPEIRDRATIGGNIAYERIGDTAPVLLSCGAKIVIKTDSDIREILADRFWTADGRNDLNYDEWIMRISLQIPKGSAWGAAFGKTRAWDLTREPGAAGAVCLSLDEKDTVTGIRGGLRVGTGYIRRMFPLEKALKNRTASDESLESAVSAMLSGIRDLPSEKDIAGLLRTILRRAVDMAKERRSL